MEKLIIYQNGELELKVQITDETIWLNQKQLSELFEVESNNITYHIKNIYKQKELEKFSTTQRIRVVQREGNREVERNIDHYNLDMIISIGYRVNSLTATKFRQWATSILKSYILDGYAINQQRLSQKGLHELTATMELVRKSIEDKELKSDEAKGLFDIINGYV